MIRMLVLHAFGFQPAAGFSIILQPQALNLQVGERSVRRSRSLARLAPSKSLRSSRTFPRSRWYALLISVSAVSPARGSPPSAGGFFRPSIANENASSASPNSLALTKQSPLNRAGGRDKNIGIGVSVGSPRGRRIRFKSARLGSEEAHS